MSGVHVVSLIFLEDQEIPPWTWTTVRFPFEGESGDPWNMHRADDPAYATMPGAFAGSTTPVTGPVTDWHKDERSGLIWPSKRGWASITAEFAWRDGTYTEIRDQFVRDPLRVPNATGLEHRPRSIGVQYFSKHHEFAVKPETPVAVQVYHNQSTPLVLADGQFKMAIHDVEEPA